MAMFGFVTVYADGTACTNDRPTLDVDLPDEFTEQENEALLHDHLCHIAPLERPAMLDVSNVYADGTACTANSPKIVDTSIPSEFTEPEHEASFHDYLCGIAPLERPAMPLDSINVYADGTTSIDSNVSPAGLPYEFSEPEKEASFHAYLSDMAPPVALQRMPPVPLDFDNVYADGTACTESPAKSNLDGLLPNEFSEPEKEAAFHEYLCDLAPMVKAMGEVSSPKSPDRRSTTSQERQWDQILGA